MAAGCSVAYKPVPSRVSRLDVGRTKTRFLTLYIVVITLVFKSVSAVFVNLIATLAPNDITGQVQVLKSKKFWHRFCTFVVFTFYVVLMM